MLREKLYVTTLFIFSLLVGVLFSCQQDDEIVPDKPLTPTSEQPANEPEIINDSTITEPDSVLLPDSVSQTDSLPPGTPPNIDTVFNDDYQPANFNGLPYRILLPRNYNASKKYPLLIFLHGKGERGNDNHKQLTWGAPLFKSDSIRQKYPAIVVFPQCPADHYWYDDWSIDILKKLIEELQAKYSIDQHQLLIGGLSMGAFGTFALVAEMPATFSRAVVIAGDGDHKKAGKMTKTKWRIFAGRKDQVVPSAHTENMAKKLKDSGASVSLTVYPDADHLNSWVNAFAEPDFCKWLFGK
jgi:predicted peptidase